MPLPVTVTDRFRAAWRAFRWNYKPDPQAFAKHQTDRYALQTKAVGLIEPFDRALVESVAAGSNGAAELLSRAMAGVVALAFEDQFQVMKFIVRSNPAAALYPATREWSRNNAADIARAVE
jgi:hypothetical protein